MTHDPEQRRVDPGSVIGAAWPVDGPYSAELTATAARAAAELVRYLNYATRSAAGLPYPAAVYEVLGGLARAVSGLPQALRQTAQRLVELADRPDATADTLGVAVTPTQAAAYAAADLAIAVQRLDGAAQNLAGAQTMAGRLYLAGEG